MQVSDSNKIYDKYSAEITKKINEIKSKPDVDAVRKKNIKTSGKLDYAMHIISCTYYKLAVSNIKLFIRILTADALCRVISGECAVEKLCLKCLTFPKDEIEEHPFFIGSLCKDCSV